MRRIIRNPRIMGPLAALAIGGCGIVSFLGLEGEPPRVFPHKICGTDQKVECKDCHPTGETEPGAGMPEMKKCMECHEDLDREKPVGRRIRTIYGEVPEWSSFTSLPDGILFSHKAHFEVKDGKKVLCLDCHVGMDQSMAVTKEDRISMDACVACHARQERARECAVCHVVITKEWLPPSHTHNWKREHGMAVRSNEVPPYWNRCSLCHLDSYCAGCHQDEPPRSHTNFWRLQGHGVAVAIDRSHCIICHREDFCDRCHHSTRPRSHLASWGSPQDRHCLSCHFPLQGERCILCHNGTPSHSQAARLPASHNTALNCRQCHGPGKAQPLPHLDKGDECTACHF